MSVDLQEVYLRLYPDKSLSQKCHDIDPKSEDLPAVLDKMVAIMMAYDGVGLASPQVGLDWNVFVVRLGEEEPRALVNPRIESFGEKKCKSQEGCLSIPGIMANLDCRYEEVTISTCLPLSSERLTLTLTGAEAVIFQHEYEHLQGITLFDNMQQVQKMMRKKKYIKTKKKHEKQVQQYTKLRIKNEQLKQIVESIEGAKNDTKNSDTTGISNSDTGGTSSEPRDLTTAAAEGSP